MPSLTASRCSWPRSAPTNKKALRRDPPRSVPPKSANLQSIPRLTVSQPGLRRGTHPGCRRPSTHRCGWRPPCLTPVRTKLRAVRCKRLTRPEQSPTMASSTIVATAVLRPLASADGSGLQRRAAELIVILVLVPDSLSVSVEQSARYLPGPHLVLDQLIYRGPEKVGPFTLTTARHSKPQ